ncbi:MAG: hypothetical protein U9N42_07810 [Campylobacterota bacterium]|nr:hypothetical protein [Campylobacterota bacterium]
MRKTFNIIFIVLMLFFLFYSLSIIGNLSKLFYSKGTCNEYLTYNGIELFSSEKMESSIKNQQLLSDLTPFEWDKLYVILPYSSDFDIMKHIGFRPKVLGTTCIYTHDDRTLFLFLKNDTLIAYGDVPIAWTQIAHYNSKHQMQFEYYSTEICIEKKEGVPYVDNCNH